MIVRETIVHGRGNMTATHQGGIHTVIATTAGEVAAAVTVVAAAGVGARITSETATERGTGIERGTETGIEIAAGAHPTAELGLEAGVEVRSERRIWNDLRCFTCSPVGSVFCKLKLSIAGESNDTKTQVLRHDLHNILQCAQSSIHLNYDPVILLTFVGPDRLQLTKKLLKRHKAYHRYLGFNQYHYWLILRLFSPLFDDIQYRSSPFLLETCSELSIGRWLIPTVMAAAMADHK